MPETNATRTIETQIEIGAPVEDVWKALTDGESLANWFPLEARVKPGAGGSIWTSWGEHGQYEAPIEIWEPNQHLRTVWMKATPAAEAEQAKKAGHFIPADVAVDYCLESNGGATVLRLVHSGFSRDAAWDSQYDGTVRGWAFELRGLKHYLERHNGAKRTVVHATHPIDNMTLAEAWKRLMSKDGLGAGEPVDGLSPGDHYVIRTSTGDELAGEVYICNPPSDFCGTDERHNHALLRLRCDESCVTQGQSEINLWLSTYGLAQKETDALQTRWQSMLNDLLGAPVAAK